MKKCPTCEKTFDDSMRFCQVDGTPLVDDVPAFDPYATIVAQPIPTIEPAAPAEPPVHAAEPEAEAPVVTALDPVPADPEPIIHQTVGSLPIAEPEDFLEVPSADPLKTMYVSEAEMKDVLHDSDAGHEIIEIPPIDTTPSPEPPSFIATEVTPPSPFGAPPPSPFSASSEGESAPVEEPANTAPTFEPPALDEPYYDEPATMIQPQFTVPAEEPKPFEEPQQPSYEPAAASPFDPPPAPVAEWTPPQAPDASWQNQEIGSNTPFQPPVAGVGGQNTTLGLVSLVLGILSFLCLGFLGSIPAIILGFMQRSKIKSNPNEYGGGGMAMAGIILGVLNIIVTGIFLVLLRGSSSLK